MRPVVADYAMRLAARGTKQVLLRRGAELGVVLGAGFPKSGTVWLCQLLGTALGMPYPRKYQAPIIMPAVIHGHWRYDPRVARAAYIRRDGRDIMVSMYFYYVRALRMPERPARGRELRVMFDRLYGSGFDPDAVRDNLPRFIERQMEHPRSSDGLAWHEHVSDWWERPGVAQVTYEELRTRPVPALRRLMGDLGHEPDEKIARLAAERWSIETVTGRSDGSEDRTSFVRKASVGDWRNHFSREAAEVFDAFAGEHLVRFGYEKDRSWMQSL